MFDDIFGVEIIPIQGISTDEINDLIKRHDICAEAKRQLLAFQISWQDYLDLLECAGVNIQEYLNITNENALILGF